jgi:hypothetical protein
MKESENGRDGAALERLDDYRNWPLKSFLIGLGSHPMCVPFSNKQVFTLVEVTYHVGHCVVGSACGGGSGY